MRNSGATDLSAANHDFRLLRGEVLDGQRCFVLEMIPLRRDRSLIRGLLWVDADSYLPRRSEGTPAPPPPSLWLRGSHIVLRYGEVEAMWLQTASESTADVRLIGRHIMETRDLHTKSPSQPPQFFPSRSPVNHRVLGRNRTRSGSLTFLHPVRFEKFLGLFNFGFHPVFSGSHL